MGITSWSAAALKLFSLSLACLCFAIGAAQADFIYQKTTLVIEPVVPDELPQSNAAGKVTPRIIATEPIRLQAQQRPASSFQSPSLYLTQGLAVNEAYLIPLPLLPRPKSLDSPNPQHKIEPANVYAPLDLLAVDSHGKILTLWPELKLNELAAPLLLPENSHAILYLSSGRSAQLGITPGAIIRHDLFQTTPKSVQ